MAIYERGRFSIEWYWDKGMWPDGPEFHCTRCCYFWFSWGPLTIAVGR
jgi:hypothetical protein